MEGARGLGLVAWYLTATLVGSIEPVGADAQGPDLNRVARELRLEAHGIREWLGALGAGTSPSAPERLLVVTLDGRTVAACGGSDQYVTFGLEIDRQMLTAGSGPESPPGLAGLVQQALVRLGSRDVTIDELVRQLQVTLRVPASLTRLPAHEQLVVVDRARRVVAHADGTRSSVDEDGHLREQLLRTGKNLVLVHNHPGGTGLSASDLGQLTKPGVRGVIAVGHDGSLYAASFGKAFIAFQIAGPPVTLAGFELPGHTTIMTFVMSAEMEVRRQRAGSFTIEEHAFLSHFRHIVSLALGEAGAIHYRSILAGARRDSFNRYRDEFGHITEETRRKLAADLKRRVRAIPR